MEDSIPIVFVMEPAFWTNIPHLYPNKWLESFAVSDGHKKCMDSVFFVIDDELSEDNSVVTIDS
jgi:hypothetical protein